MNPHLSPSLYAYSYTGLRVGATHDSVAPSLEDISVSLGRICRYAGNCTRFWPVLLHSFVVADLLPTHLRAYGLLHDSPESVISDIPRGFKNAELTAVEEKIYRKILDSFGLNPPTGPEQERIKQADNEVLVGEVWTVGTSALRKLFPDRSPLAEKLICEYAREFPPEDVIRPDGLAVMAYRRRLLKCLDEKNSNEP